ncbi:hypothetical protein Gpo141_00010462 [Globisporangium polare]
MIQSEKVVEKRNKYKDKARLRFMDLADLRCYVSSEEEEEEDDDDCESMSSSLSSSISFTGEPRSPQTRDSKPWR